MVEWHGQGLEASPGDATGILSPLGGCRPCFLPLSSAILRELRAARADCGDSSSLCSSPLAADPLPPCQDDVFLFFFLRNLSPLAARIPPKPFPCFFFFLLSASCLLLCQHLEEAATPLQGGRSLAAPPRDFLQVIASAPRPPRRPAKPGLLPHAPRIHREPAT